MEDSRARMIYGIATAIELMGLKRPNETMVQAIVRYGDDDNITKNEVEEVINGKFSKAA